LQTDPAVLAPLLTRSVNLGENLVELDSVIGNLFQNLMPAASLSLAQKLSIVIRGAVSEPDLFNNLLLLARLHPGVHLCLGTAAAELMASTGKTTFEIREYDPI